jgi:hypothetical protein
MVRQAHQPQAQGPRFDKLIDRVLTKRLVRFNPCSKLRGRSLSLSKRLLCEVSLRWFDKLTNHKLRDRASTSSGSAFRHVGGAV